MSSAKTTDQFIKTWELTGDGSCYVCNTTPTGPWAYHVRLDVFICHNCFDTPHLTNVKGEDISGHAFFVGSNATKEAIDIKKWGVCTTCEDYSPHAAKPNNHILFT